ncbi:peptidyl-prolyl cis-trans isomerase SurA [Dysgonomonas hofstadii]|uniref:Peptidyl-prolyl cis-trans isomerase SurA n=1 Tax=Dysgonomonas hofstadii TaxID=637886 RepID=A0A840CIF7_9BACT|nr:peptidylprolyl isomerase [Dysgonomonas hofstadii]MBB4034449.1 peptidyl-prolyl cis-trans isomerase SurA [Dysgonomonas hofstadii]
MVKQAGRFILLLVLLGSGLFCKAQDNIIDQIIWVVGDEAILKSDVEKARLMLLSRGERIEGDPYCFIPEQLAVQKLFLDQAKIDSVDVPASELSRGVASYEKRVIANLGSKEKAEEYMQAPMSQLREEWREEIRNDYLVTEAKKNIVGKKTSLTPSEVRRYYSQLPQDSLPYIPTTVEVQIITIEPIIPLTEIDKVKERLRDFTNRINAGETSFSSLAIMYSEDGSAANGGETGFNGRGQWVPEFASMAFSLNDPKKVSNIVETEYGFHIIQLIERRGDLINVRHILMRPKVPAEEIDKAINRLDTIATYIKENKVSFEEAAGGISTDKDTRRNNGLMVNRKESSNYGTPRFTMEELPAEVGRVVDKMKIGEVSAPFKMMQNNGKEAVAIVKLRSRTEGHVANVSDDYQALKEIVEAKKEEEVLKKWLQNKIKDTYIRIEDNWKNCDFLYSGWVKE